MVGTLNLQTVKIWQFKMTDDNLKMSKSILQHIGKGYSFHRNVSRHARVRKDLHPDKWRKLVSRNGAARNNYAAPEIREAGRREEKHQRSKAWKIKVECY